MEITLITTFITLIPFPGILALNWYKMISERGFKSKLIYFQAEERVNGDTAVDEVKPVVVRFKKIRTTELALLSDEAESFMFGEPKKEDSEEVSVDFNVRTP